VANKNNYLFIGDVHIPFEHPRALQFCKALQKDFSIPHENIYSVGDILDLYHFSRWPKSPEAKLTVNQELDLAREKLRKWIHAFPKLHLCASNHDDRIMKAALNAQLPAQILRSFQEIFEIPNSWTCKENFFVKELNTLVCHGEEYADALQASIAYGCNTIQGHHHSKFGVQYRKSLMQELYGAATGWLGEEEQFAFAYGKKSKQKMILGSIVVVDKIPYAIPLK
jgi:hypothetical protein